MLNQEICEIIGKISDLASSQRKMDIILQVREYVQKHLSDVSLSIDEIADSLSLSTGYLRKIFKDVSNRSISDYILDERINCADG